MGFGESAVWGIMPSLLEGAKVTLFIAAIGLLFGFLVGLSLGAIRAYRVLVLNWLALLYTGVICGTPMLLQMMFIYFVLPQFSFWGHSLKLGLVQVGILTIAINSSASIAVIVRHALLLSRKSIQNVAHSTVISGRQRSSLFVWPLAWRHMIAPLGMQCITSLKDTSLLSLLGIMELMRQAQNVAGATYKVTETWLSAGLLYLIMTASLYCLLRLIEKRMCIDE